MPTGTYKFALQPGAYDLAELKTMHDLVQRVDKSQGNIYVRFTDTHENMKFISHSGELKIKADGYDTEYYPHLHNYGRWWAPTGSSMGH